MKLFSSVLLVVACAGALFAQGSKAGDCIRRGDIYRDAKYAHPLPALKQVVAEKARGRRNTFYISPVCYFDNRYSNTVVYWREGRALILWEPDASATKERGRHDLVGSRRFWRLDKDVVPTLADVGGSSFLLTKADARHDIRDCVRNGRRFVLYKRRSPNDTAQQIVAREPRLRVSHHHS
jgi:hypothetical protein